jgi:hypothetical protein
MAKNFLFPNPLKETAGFHENEGIDKADKIEHDELSYGFTGKSVGMPILFPVLIYNDHVTRFSLFLSFAIANIR